MGQRGIGRSLGLRFENAQERLGLAPLDRRRRTAEPPFDDIEKKACRGARVMLLEYREARFAEEGDS
jgi:hypothetical protein